MEADGDFAFGAVVAADLEKRVSEGLFGVLGEDFGDEFLRFAVALDGVEGFDGGIGWFLGERGKRPSANKTDKN